MNRFVFVNVGGVMLGAAQRVIEEGDLGYLVRNSDKPPDHTGDGLIDPGCLINNLWGELDSKEVVIIFDDNGQGDLADHLRADGYKVIGGSSFADELEYDRTLGTKIMSKLGLKTPPTNSFTKIKDGLDFLAKVKDPEQRFVFKPCGCDFAGGSKTYTAKNVKDLEEYMNWLQSDMTEKKYTIDEFELQEFIDGYEADFSAYFDGEKFMEGSNCIDIEEKKVGDGNKGQAVGCMGNVIYFPKNDKYFKTYIEKMAPMLKKKGFVGQISINNIFAKSDGQPYGLEFTPRLGWDGHPTELAIHKAAGKKVSEFYLALANKTKFDFNHELVGCGVRVYSATPEIERPQIVGRRFTFDKAIQESVYLYSASYEDGVYEIEKFANETGVLVANGVDKTVPKAISAVYDDILPKIDIPDAYFRNEVGKRAAEVMKFLSSKGWL